MNPSQGAKGKKSEWFIRLSIDYHVLNAVAQEFNLTLAWKKQHVKTCDREMG